MKTSWYVHAASFERAFLYDFITSSDDRPLRSGRLMLCQEFVRKTATSMWHMCGTVKMGKISDPSTCVDSEFCVIGVKGLRVVDMSVAPFLPRSGQTLCMSLDLDDPYVSFVPLIRVVFTVHIPKHQHTSSDRQLRRKSLPNTADGIISSLTFEGSADDDLFVGSKSQSRQ